MVKYLIPGAAGTSEYNDTFAGRERQAYSRSRVVIRAEAPVVTDDDDRADIKRLMARSANEGAAQTIGPSDAKVVQWLCKAVCSGQGESYLMAARREQAVTRLNPDPNLVAAERFMGGYEGSINEVALGFQFVGKQWRETWMAGKVREMAPASAWNSMLFAMFFGKNGSPASSASFTTRWGLSGIGHRYMKIKPGSAESPFHCDCQEGALMRVAVFLLLLLPLVVYLDVIRFGAPGLSFVAVVALLALLVWAGFRALFKRPLPGRWVLVWALLLLACPALVLPLATRQEEKIALSVTLLAKPITRFKAEKGRFPETLREVPDFSAGQDFVTDRSLRVNGRVVSYGYASKSVTKGPDDAAANLSYWSFGAMQRKIFNVGRGAFDAPMNE